MINTEDYKLWLDDNKDFINLIKKNIPLFYDSLRDIFDVIQYIEAVYEIEKKIDEDLEIIFDVGFSYLFEVVEEVKLYYQNYFNHDIILFSRYSIVLNYLIYLNDLKETLVEQNLYNDDLNKIISKHLKTLDDILKNKTDFNDDVIKNINEELDLHISSLNVLTTIEIFSRIDEELKM